MITRVRLKNWKSHLDSDLKFSRGVNVLTGVMGSGKSSIVEAISFALFGTFHGLKSRRLDLESLIMKKPEKKARCQVEMDFSVDGRGYYVKRVVERGKGTGHAEIRRDGELLNVNARSVTEEVVRALQMDYDLFSKAVYSEQNGIDYFLRIPRGKRKGEIDRMLKVDRFEKARLEMLSVRNKVRGRREEILRVLSDMEKEDTEKKMDEVKAGLGKLQKERDGLDVELVKVRKGIGKASERLLEAEKIEAELNQTKVLLEGAKAGLEEAQESLSRMKKRFKGKDLKGLEKDIGEKEGMSVKMGKDIMEMENSIDEKRTVLASVNNMIKMCRENLEGLEKAGAKCPVCDSDITDSKRKELMGKRADEEKVLMERAKSVAQEMGKLSAKRNGLEKDKHGMELETEKLKSIKGEFGELEDVKRRGREYKQRKGELNERLKSLKGKLKEVGLEGLRKKEQELVAKESEVMAKISGIQERLSDKQSVLKELEGRKALMQKYIKEARRDEKIMENLGSFENVLKITQDELREEFLKTVNIILGDVWDELYPYGDFHDIRLAIEDDYVLQLKELGGWISVEGTVSGGERSMAVLALRVAFSMAFLPNLKWLMLDEPTHNLDANAIRQFSSILRDKMGLFAEQVFLITHEERISEGVTGNLYRMERDKSKDEPTKVVGV